VTLRIEILAWIMYSVEVKEDELIRVFGEAARPEIQSLLEIGVIREFWKRTGVFYEVTKIWAKGKRR
jgi:chromosome segregation and condensation protein ScpB